MADFDPTLFGGSVSDTAVEPKLTTYYYPATPQDTKAAGLDPKMEGGIQGGAGFSDVDLREHTLEKYKDKQSDYVAVAIAGRPTGKEFPLKVGGVTVNAKNVDTGGGLRQGQIDVATSNPELARTGIEHGTGFDPSMFGGATPQPTPEPHFAGGIPEGFDPNSFAVDSSGAASATQTPPGDKDTLAGRVGSAIAQGGAAYAKSQQPVQPAKFQYTPPQPPTAGGNQVKPIGMQDWANLITRAAFKVTNPTNLMAQDAFDQTYARLPEKAKTALNTPLVNSGAARGLIQTGAQLAGAGAPELLRFVESTRAGQGLMDTAANTLSSATTGASALSMPAFFIPGVAETWAARQAKDTPKAWGQVQQAVQQNGIFSREGFAALSQEMVRLGTIGLAAKGGAGLRASLAEKVGGAPRRPYTKPPIQPTTAPPLPESAHETVTLHHATPKNFSAFSPESATQTGLGGSGHYFSDTPQNAAYGKGTVSINVPRSKIANLAELENKPDFKQGGNIDELLKGRGYEGTFNPSTREYVVYAPNKFLTKSAIANKYQPETAGLGQGSSPAAAIARGSEFTPEQINQHLSDLNQGVGDIQAQTAAVRVESARLQARSEAAGKALQANPRSIELRKAADDAFKDWADFQHGPQAKLKATWARMGHELQGSVPVDLSSVNGLRQKFLNEMGREATPTETKVLGRYADKVERTEKARVSEVDRALDELSKRSKNIDASEEAMSKMREDIMNRMGKKQPCRN